MRRMPMIIQLFSMFGLTILLLASVLGYTVYQFSTISDEYENAINVTAARTIYISKAEDSFHSGISELRGFIAYADPNFEESAIKQFNDSYNEVKDFASKAEYKDTKLEAEKLEKMLGEYIDTIKRLLQARKINDPIYNTILANAKSKTELINQQFDIVLNAQEKALSNNVSTLVEREARSEKTIIGLVSIILILIAAIVFWYSRNTARRIGILRTELLAISHFDLSTKDIHATRNDEIGDIAEATLGMKKALRGIIDQLRNNADTLAASSQELNATVEEQLNAANMVAKTASEIAAGSVQNTTNITDMSATIQQISASSEEMAASAAQVNNNTQNAVEDASHGMELIGRVVQQNEIVGKTMSEIAAISSSLVKGSSSIQEIITVIRNIASQTNLLALNAAIEAARAGEAGRGFAVVAEEVRKLAEQSAAATNHIGEIIGKMTGDISLAVQAVESANKEVLAGKDITAETQQGYNQIIIKLGNVRNGIEHIAQAVDETASGMQTIVGSVQNISAVAEETTASTETVAAAAQEQTASLNEISSNAEALSRMASELNDITRKFKL